MSFEKTAALASPAAAPRADAPVSTLPYRDGYAGLIGLCAAWLLVMAVRPHPLIGTWIVLLATALPMLACGLHRTKPGTRRRQGFAPLAWGIGFVLATLPFAVFHAQGGGLDGWQIVWLIVAPGFVLRWMAEFARNGAVSGGFPLLLGQALLPPDRQKLQALAGPARLWALKAIFIPLYGASLFALVNLGLTTDMAAPLGWLMLIVVFAYTVDLTFGLTGYLFASNDLAPTMRSTQRLVIGWIVCLACYGPVFAHWPAFEAVVHAEIGWPEQLVAGPVTIAAAIALLGLLALYASASVHFGLRFSNLSNRGVVAAGPYRLMKHPAYFAHAANAWLIALVLMPAGGIELGLSQWLVPVAFTALYWARARTEEMHLREDPAYVAYADWIDRHGLLARVLQTLGRRTPA